MHLLASQSLLSPWVKLLEVTHSYCEHTSVLEILNHHHQIMILLANIIKILTDFKIFFRISLTRFQVKVTLCALCPFFLECISSSNKMQLKNNLWLRGCRFIFNVLICSYQSNLYLWLLSSITSAYTTCTEWSLLFLILYLIFSHLLSFIATCSFFNVTL